MFEWKLIPSRALSLACISSLIVSSCASILLAQVKENHLRVLTTTRQIHSLPLQEATLSYPVRFRAVITYYDPYIDSRRPSLFVHDATGAVFVELKAAPAINLVPGNLVEVTGFSAAGDFAPIVNGADVKVLGKSRLPAEAPRVSLGQMLAGGYDGQWVEVEGVIRSVQTFGRNVTFEVSTSDGLVNATSLKEPDEQYSRLIDAKVLIHANEAPTFNKNRQLTGMHLLFPSLTQVTIEQSGNEHPFSLPVLPLYSLLRYNPTSAFLHWVHTRGPVILQWPGRSLCIQNGDDGLCVRTTQTDPLPKGTLVDIAGFPSIGDLSPTLDDAVYKPSGHSQQVSATSISAEQALHGNYDSRLVVIEGKLIGEDSGTKDPTMILSSGGFLFPVVLPNASASKGFSNWLTGSTLRITGVCSTQSDIGEAIRGGFSLPASFRILVGSSDDVVVIRRASWMTPSHLFPVLATVLAITLCALGWAIALRNRIAVQNLLIKNQNSTLEDLSFKDGLTGVPNRRKFDETFESEFDIALNSSAVISLLMIDIDYFKLLNDTYGHQRGDECLTQVAQALAAKLRASDVIARYGGEEFVVIMPKCDEYGARAAADRMHAAVESLSIVHAGSPFNHRLSISVGAVTMLPQKGSNSRSLIALADRALYQSKLLGRNRTTWAMPTLDKFLGADGAALSH